ncbi:MAG: PQQ-like beta-propeller repeat protein [Planctomyces sp.]|nr:PQQ-like beta-propeller repeat protein [Planctomyces sp.]
MFRRHFLFSVVILAGSIFMTPKLSAQGRETTTPADWSQFRGPGGQGVIQSSSKLPTEWDATKNVAWKTALPGAGASSPIVWKDHIYLTAYTGFFVPNETGGSQEDLKRHLLCFDRESGKELWNTAVKAKLPEEERIRDHGFAASTPAADKDHIYCFFGKSGLVAFDHQGKQKWQADCGSGTNGWGSGSSPVLFEKFVIVNASVESESILAFDRMSGKKVWSADGIKEAWNTPVVIQTAEGKPELIVPTHGAILAFSPETGKQLWSCKTDITWYMVPSIVAKDGIVYCLGGRSGVASLAVRSGGRGDVTKTHRLWTSNKGSNVSSPVVHGDKLYWVHDNLGIAYCAELESGNIVYEQRLNRADQSYASAVLANGNLYYLMRDGRTFVVEARPAFSEVSINDLRDGGVFNGSIAVDRDRLLIRSDKFLYCISSAK